MRVYVLSNGNEIHFVFKLCRGVYASSETSVNGSQGDIREIELFLVVSEQGIARVIPTSL